MLKLPIYKRVDTYYLHLRIQGKQVKKSLFTDSKASAIIRGSSLLKALMSDPDNFDYSKFKKFEIDLDRGILKADGPDDHARMMQSLELLLKARAQQSQKPSLEVFHPPSPTHGGSVQSALKLIELLDKFFLLKQGLSEATQVSYRTTIQEFSKYIKNRTIDTIGISDITKYQEWLAKNLNATATIDNKIGRVRMLFNFAIKQGYFFGANPAANRNLQTKKEKLEAGPRMFELSEIRNQKISTV